MSGSNEHQGKFSLNFKSEKSYSVFGRDWAKVNSDFNGKGTISKPTAQGKWTYDVAFQWKGGCETFLGGFNLAYNKAFKSDGLATGVGLDQLGGYQYRGDTLQTLTTADYTAQLLSCAIG